MQRRVFLKLSGVTGGITVITARRARAGPTKKLSGRSTTWTSGGTQPPAGSGWWAVWPGVW